MKIKFLSDMVVAPDHVHARRYKAGEVHEVGPDRDPMAYSLNDDPFSFIPQSMADSLLSDGTVEQTDEDLSEIAPYVDPNHAIHNSQPYQPTPQYLDSSMTETR